MKFPRPWHPYLFGLYPILFLYVQNSRVTPLTEIIGPIVVVLIATALLVGLLNLLIRNLLKTSLVVSTLTLYFFSWGQLPVGFRHHKNVLAYLLGLAVIAALVSVIRTRSSLKTGTIIANRLSLALVVLQVGMGGWAIANRPSLQALESEPIPAPSVAAPLPNIYYIVPDGYGRSDVLADLYDYDNSELISHLRDLGFYVADSSCSNYSQTLLSLTSSFNMQLISQLADLDPDSDDRLGFRKFYANSRLHRFLRQYDYTFAAFHLPYSLIPTDQLDYVFKPWYDFSEFSLALIQRTPLSNMLQRFALYRLSRDRIVYVMEELARLDGMAEPYFLMAHIICPHPPFLWDEEGNAYHSERPYYAGDGGNFMAYGGTRREYIEGYRNQTRVLDRLLRQTVDGILSLQRDNPPIIIIQGDHGPGAYLSHTALERTDVGERFPILNAYYFPGVDAHRLYPTISPVNSFRVVLNTYFGLELPLLEDRAYYSTWNRPFDFVDVTDSLRGPQTPSSRP